MHVSSVRRIALVVLVALAGGCASNSSATSPRVLPPVSSAQAANASMTFASMLGPQRHPKGVPAGGSTLYMSNSFEGGNPAGEIRVFGSQQTGGNIAPIRIISGPNTLITNPGQIAVGPTGEVFVSVWSGVAGDARAIEVFAPGASGNVAPIRQIKGVNTQFYAGIYAIDVDAAGYLYVYGRANPAQYVTVYTLQVFAPGAQGNAVPINTITQSSAESFYDFKVLGSYGGELIAVVRHDAGFAGQVLIYSGTNLQAPVCAVGGSSTGFDKNFVENVAWQSFGGTVLFVGARTGGTSTPNTGTFVIEGFTSCGNNVPLESTSVAGLSYVTEMATTIHWIPAFVPLGVPTVWAAADADDDDPQPNPPGLYGYNQVGVNAGAPMLQPIAPLLGPATGVVDPRGIAFGP